MWGFVFYDFDESMIPRTTIEKQIIFLNTSFGVTFSLRLILKTFIINKLSTKIKADSVDDKADLTTKGNLDKA